MISVIIIVGIFFLCLCGLWFLKKLNVGFNIRTITGMVAGIVFGAVLQFAVGNKEITMKSLSWISLVGTGYVRLLHMIVFPLQKLSPRKSPIWERLPCEFWLFL